jgi:PPK2 family polyphosphate:nucleotide phosphotransferase
MLRVGGAEFVGIALVEDPMDLARLVRRFRVDKPENFRLSKHDPANTDGLDIDKKEAKDLLAEGTARLSDLQERLYAQDRWAMLAIFQAMDAAGKDSVIKHVMSGVNPQGCDVHSFKRPSDEEEDHDFLWRSSRRLPERGRIGIFNRSYYEEVLVVRVHKEVLDREKLPASLVGKDIWRKRFKDIRAHERYLARNGLVIVKFFLHVSKEEQRRRFLERLDTPSKNWKFSSADVLERKLWDKYMAAYEDMIRHTSRPEAPWYVVPADNKWFTRIVVAAAMVETLNGLDLKFPSVTGAAAADLERSRRMLLRERS